MFLSLKGLFAGLMITAAAAVSSHRDIGTIRSIDGAGNNPNHPEWGRAGEALLRIVPPAYGDGYGSMAGHDRPGPRDVSNVLMDQAGDMPNASGMSDMVWQWGQFLDHDLDLTPSHDPQAHPDENENIPTATTDPWFIGTPIGFMRSLFEPGTSLPGVPRRQVNVITAFIDASNVYGSDAVRAEALRANDGTGRLKVSEGDLLPFNTAGLPNAQPGGLDPGLFFLAGDIRANEQVGLTAMHTLFVREHNRIADEIALVARGVSDDAIYEMARRIVIAEMQIITYNEFLPALLGRDAMPPYRGYRVDVNPGIANIFSTACYRFGHSAISPTLMRLDASMVEVPQGHLPLRSAFFDPRRITGEGGIDPILRGLARQPMQIIDTNVVADLRNFLFGPPGSGGFDLVSLNIQRGRDHGLADYNSVREAFGLPRKQSIEEISPDPAIREKLETLYGGVDDIDPWVGGLAEDHVEGALVGELVFHVIRDQFVRLRDGDRHWYQNDMHPLVSKLLERQTLADVIRRNTGIGRELQDDVFRVPSDDTGRPRGPRAR